MRQAPSRAKAWGTTLGWAAPVLSNLVASYNQSSFPIDYATTNVAIQQITLSL